MENLLTTYTLVLLPGLDGTGKLFKPFIEQFPRQGNIISITYPADRFIPFAELPDYIIPQLPKDKPLVILGESYSGPVAAVLAGRTELDVRGVIFVAAFACFPMSFLKVISRLLPLSWLFRIPMPKFIARRYCFGRWTTPERIKALREVIKANKPGVLAKRARSGACLDVRYDLAVLNIPSLYIQAYDDKLVPNSALDLFKAYVHHLVVEKIEGPHFILQTQPLSCAIMVTEFISSLQHGVKLSAQNT